MGTGRCGGSPGWNSRPKHSCLLHLPPPTSGATHYLSPAYNHTQREVRFGCYVYEWVSEGVFLFMSTTVCYLHGCMVGMWAVGVCGCVFFCVMCVEHVCRVCDCQWKCSGNHTQAQMSCSYASLSSLVSFISTSSFFINWKGYWCICNTPHELSEPPLPPQSAFP